MSDFEGGVVVVGAKRTGLSTKPSLEFTENVLKKRKCLVSCGSMGENASLMPEVRRKIRLI